MWLPEWVYCSTIRKEAIDRGNEFGALLTDLSEAFDRINHPLLIAKLYNYGVSLLSINMIFYYLSNQIPWTKTNECFSERSRIEHGVPQDPILGPLLFNINSNFWVNKHFHWFQYNNLKEANPGKCHLRLSSKTTTDVSMMMLHLKLAQKKPYLESCLTQDSVLTNMFLPFAVKLVRTYMV